MERERGGEREKERETGGREKDRNRCIYKNMHAYTLDQSIVSAFLPSYAGKTVSKCVAVTEEVQTLLLNKGLDVGRLEGVGRIPRGSWGPVDRTAGRYNGGGGGGAYDNLPYHNKWGKQTERTVSDPSKGMLNTITYEAVDG